MRRLGAMLAATVPAALFSLASVSLAQDPAKTSISDESVFVEGSAEPQGFGPGAESPAGPAQICAPRNDLYTNYSEAFMNPNAACAPTNTAGAMGQFLSGPRYYKWIFSYEQVLFTRSNPGNKVLVTTSPDIFDQSPGVGPVLNGDPNGSTLYGYPVLNQPISGGIIQVYNPNTPGVGQVFLPGENPNLNFETTFNNPQRPTPLLIANQMMMQTDDFDFKNTWGQRPKIGIEFQDESRLTFSWFNSGTQRPDNLVLDVSGTAFATRVISSQTSPFIFEYQRFGYLNSPFVTSNPLFGGERRRQIGDDPSQVPQSPFVEGPPVLAGGDFVPTSSDVPREPTVNDPSTLDGPEDVNSPSLLWRDGEVAIAQYTSQLIGSELLFEKSLFEWFSSPWKIWALGGVRYLGLNESFVFTFADIAPTGNIGPTGYKAFSPFDRFAANNVGATPDTINYKAQPSIQTVAITSFRTYNNIVAPELGIRCVRPFCMDLFEFDLAGKGLWGGNWATRKASLVRGDGLVGVDRKTSSFATSGAFECQLGLNFVPHPNIRIRGGWEAMYLMGIASATGNVNFNLDQVNRPNFHDQVLFTGWYFGGEVTY